VRGQQDVDTPAGAQVEHDLALVQVAASGLPQPRLAATASAGSASRSAAA
jgi:hypothetical protein